MMLDVYSFKGKKVGTAEVAADVFGVGANPDLIHQVVVAYAANRRRPWAHTKNRAEVSGGGRKPWRQKGTGRARHGSTRSPIWVKGGITFGPRNERRYGKKINVTMRRRAFAAALSSKVRDDEFTVIDQWALGDAKTGELVRALTALARGRHGDVSAFEKGMLLIMPSKNEGTAADEMLARAARNLPWAEVRRSGAVSIMDILRFRYVVIARAALAAMDRMTVRAVRKRQAA